MSQAKVRVGFLRTHHSSLSISQRRRGGSISSSLSCVSVALPGGSKRQGSMPRKGSISSPDKSAPIAPSKSEESEAEVELSLLLFDSAMFVIMLWFHTCDVSHHVTKIEAFMAEVHRSGKIRSLTLKFTGKKASKVGFF